MNICKLCYSEIGSKYLKESKVIQGELPRLVRCQTFGMREDNQK